MDVKASIKKLSVIAILFTFALCSRAYASAYGDNLVSNGSFSSGDKTGWTDVTGDGLLSVIDPAGISILPYSGDGSYVLDYFNNTGTADAESYQEIDVSSFASDIAQHKVNLNISGYTRKYWNSASSIIRLDLYDNLNNLLDTYSIQGPDVASDPAYPLRNQNNEWSEVSETYYNINSNTRLIKISLAAYIEQGVTDPYAPSFKTADCDYVEFDGINLNLTLDTNPPGGYSVDIGPTSITDANKTNFAYTFAGAEVGATYNYTITSSGGGGSVTGSGTIASATDTISGIDVSGLSDGTLTLSVTLTDVAGNTGSAATDTVLKDVITPSGYSVSIASEYVNNANKNNFSFTFSGAEPGAVYNYTVMSSGGGGPVTGSGTISTATDTTSGINVTPLGDGTLTLNATITDAAGNEGIAATDTVSKDTTVPTAAITAGTTAGGDALVNAAEKAEGFNVVAQSSEATGKLYVVPDGTAADISDIATAKIGEANVTAANTDTTITVAANHIGISDGTSYGVYAVDAAGNTSTISGVAFTADLAAPTGGSISINGGDTYTTSTTVTLTLSATGASEMMVSEDSGFSGASYEAYATSKSFTLSSGDGTKTVYVKYRDAAGNEASGTISDSITL
ncbi:MAG TPA: hypothetical protein DEF36_20425, partial [Desulfotomaculum sp.]|nr:hypothetical protein [Desulfotomaculum sp.]